MNRSIVAYNLVDMTLPPPTPPLPPAALCVTTFKLQVCFCKQSRFYRFSYDETRQI